MNPWDEDNIEETDKYVDCKRELAHNRLTEGGANYLIEAISESDRLDVYMKAILDDDSIKQGTILDDIICNYCHDHEEVMSKIWIDSESRDTDWAYEDRKDKVLHQQMEEL